MTTLLLPIAAAAFAGELTHIAPGSVTAGGDGSADIEITVSGGDEAYAGAQFELVLGEGITIEAVSFDKGNKSGVIPPTYARGSYFFSLFAGANEFEGDFTCTVTISLEGTESSWVKVAEIQRYHLLGPGNVETAIDSTESLIEVRAAGSFAPLSLLTHNLLWVALIVVAAALAVALLALRSHMKKQAPEGTVTIDRAEYELLLAQRAEGDRKNSDPG